MTTVDPILGYNHVIKKEIWDGYMQHLLPMLVSECLLEWAPNKETYILDDPSKPKCPECFASNRLSTHLKPADTTPTTFIQLPILVEAMQLKAAVPGRVLAIVSWGKQNDCNMRYLGADRGLFILSQDSSITAREGDWIVKRPDGSFITMRPDAFWTSYEARP